MKLFGVRINSLALSGASNQIIFRCRARSPVVRTRRVRVTTMANTRPRERSQLRPVCHHSKSVAAVTRVDECARSARRWQVQHRWSCLIVPRYSVRPQRAYRRRSVSRSRLPRSDAAVLLGLPDCNDAVDERASDAVQAKVEAPMRGAARLVRDASLDRALARSGLVIVFRSVRLLVCRETR